MSERVNNSIDRSAAEISKRMTKTQSEVVGLFSLFDTVVLQRDEAGVFTLLSPTMDWFEQLLSAPIANYGRLTLMGRFAFLDHFLNDAIGLWGEKSNNSLCSGSWEEMSKLGQRYELEATAVQYNGQEFLLLSNLKASYAERRALLQTAREHLLEQEHLERQVRKRTAQIRQREEEIAMRLLGAAGLRDQETGAHVRRIGLYSAEVGRALGWSPTMVDDIRVAAPMHDIGKIGIPDNILLKPGKLTEDEFRIMKTHTVLGAQILEGSRIPLLDMSREIALYHHEKWDGSGYPEGLAGDQIPVSARIVAIVDVYDALIHRRVYKEPIPENSVLDILKASSGSHFDPSLIQVLMGILPEIRKIRDTVREEPELPANEPQQDFLNLHYGKG